MLDSTIFPIGSSGKQRRLVFRKVATTSQVITLPAGYYDIIAVGTGGSGGAINNSSGKATGGGGPAWARDWGELNTATPVTVTIGARALGVSGSANGTGGNNGGTTTVTGILNPISLTGGSGGQAGTAAPLLGGLGGVATGGKIRANGSRGGNISSSLSRCATGGGAIDLFIMGGDKTRGGDAGSAGIATGGGGVGGRGGDVIGSFNMTSGGGAGGDALDVAAAATTCGPTITGGVGNGIAPTDAEVVDLLLAFPGIIPTGSGAFSTTSPLPGGGGGGNNSPSSSTVPFGASGGNSAGTSTAVGGESIRGGGSGATTASTSAVSGTAGAAFVIISVYSEVE